MTLMTKTLILVQIRGPQRGEIRFSGHPLLKLYKSKGSVEKQVTRFGVKVHIVIYSVIHVLFEVLCLFRSNLLCMTLMIKAFRVVKIGGLGPIGVPQEGKNGKILSN